MATVFHLTKHSQTDMENESAVKVCGENLAVRLGSNQSLSPVTSPASVLGLKSGMFEGLHRAGLELDHAYMSLA